MTFGQDRRAMRLNFLVDMLAHEANAYRKLLTTDIKHYLRCITGKEKSLIYSFFEV